MSCLDRFDKPIKVDDWVEVVEQGKINHHINMVGYIGRVEEVGEGSCQVNCYSNGCGAIEGKCLRVIAEPDRATKLRIGYDSYVLLREEYKRLGRLEYET